VNTTAAAINYILSSQIGFSLINLKINIMSKENFTQGKWEIGHSIPDLETAGNLKPVIFSTPMVQAILRGEKTQTRRIIKLQEDEKIEFDNSEFRKCFLIAGNGYIKALKCKYKIGDILWVRETWRKANGMPTGYRYEWKATALEDGNPIDEPWKPSIFMPKEACRIFLKVKSIRIGRLQSITEDDAISEGVQPIKNGDVWFDYEDKSNDYGCGSAKASYMTLWCKINGRNGTNSWAGNPFVWVYEFERTDASFACS
jgi:hypothetical protein